MMKSMISWLAILMFATSTQAETEGQFSLEISVANGQILGSVQNLTTNELKTIEQFGWWEFTTVLYHDGQRWHEAKLRKGNRVVRGVFQGVTIKPGKPHTFTLALSEYELPEELSRVTKLRVITCELWSNIENIKNPNQQLQPIAGKPGSG
jgi:hypothetical protein